MRIGAAEAKAGEADVTVIGKLAAIGGERDADLAKIDEAVGCRAAWDPISLSMGSDFTQHGIRLHLAWDPMPLSMGSDAT